MTRPDEGFPPPGGGASSVIDAFLLRLDTAGLLRLCQPPGPPAPPKFVLLPVPTPELKYHVLLFFP